MCTLKSTCDSFKKQMCHKQLLSSRKNKMVSTRKSEKDKLFEFGRYQRSHDHFCYLQSTLRHVQTSTQKLYCKAALEEASAKEKAWQTIGINGQHLT